MDISLSCSFAIVSELFSGKFFQNTFVVLSAVLPIKSPVASAAF